MAEAIYYLSKLLPYLTLFPVLAILLLLTLYLLFRKGVNNNNVSLYGLFLSFSKKDILTLALIFVQFVMIIETMFINNFSILCFLFIFTPILLYGTINLDLINMIINILGSSFLLIMCFFERTFLSYIRNVDNMWYVIILLVAVCLFILVLDIYMLMRNINVLTKKRINKAKLISRTTN